MNKLTKIVSVSVLMEVAQHITVVGERGQLWIEGEVGKTHDLLWEVGPAQCKHT